MASAPVSVCLVLLLRSALASLPAPVNVSLTSYNFRHVLRWDPGPGSPPGTTYQIDRRANGEHQDLVSSSSTSCTLRLDKFMRHDLRVRASHGGGHSPWSSALAFTPYEDTVLGPPSLTLARVNNHIQVNISLPDTEGRGDILEYGPAFIVVWRTGSRTQETRTTKERSVTLWAPEQGQHCVQVRLQTEINHNTPWSPWSCISSGAAGRSRVPTVLHVLVPVLLLVVFLTLLTCGLHYVGLLCSPVPLLDMLKELQPAQIHKTILKPDWTPVEIPVCHLVPGDEDHEGWSNIYIDRRAATCSDASPSGRLTQESAQDSAGGGGTEGSGLENQVGPEGGTASAGGTDGERFSSDEEDEVQSEEDCVDLFSVTVAALTHGQTHLSHDPSSTPTRAESDGASEGYECRGSRWSHDSEEQTLSCSGYMWRSCCAQWVRAGATVAGAQSRAPSLGPSQNTGLPAPGQACVPAPIIWAQKVTAWEEVCTVPVPFQVMTPVLWALLCFGAWDRTVSSSSEAVALRPPARLNLTSDHFVHTLTWEPGADAPEGVFYQVSVVDERGTSWAPVVGCQHLLQLHFCNLTEAFPDNSASYFVRVSARLPPREASTDHSEGFSPLRDTRLDLPLMELSPCGRDLCVDLRPSRQHLRHVYDSLFYQLRTEESGGQLQSEEDFRSLSRRTVRNLLPGRRYCVSVRFWDDLVQRKPNFSRPECAVTPAGPGQDWWVVLLSLLLVLLLLLVVPVSLLLLYSGVVRVRRRRLPSVLTSVRTFRPVRLLRQRPASLSSIREVTSATPAGRLQGYQARVKSSPLPASPSCPLPSEPAAHPDLLPGSEEENYEMRPGALTAGGLGLTHEEEEDEEEEEEEEEEGGVQEVDLFSLTFGRELEEKEAEGPQQGQEGLQEEADETSVLQQEEALSAAEDASLYLRRM
ncbi:uncharacterized protein ACB058_009545 [Synchiropus picturatus]